MPMEASPSMRTAQPKELANYIQFTGVVAGDPHLGNFSVIPVTIQSNNKREMRFLNVDFDDAGIAPFVLDFVRFEISVRAISSDIKRSDLLAAYLNGLAQKPIAPPEDIQDFLNRDVKDYDADTLKYVLDHSKKTAFDFEPGKIERYASRVPTVSEITDFMKMRGFKVIDIASRPRARGGSKDELRIWVLTGQDKDRQIMELKEMGRQGVDYYQDQSKSPTTWLNNVRAAFWPGIDGSSYDLVSIGKKWFWLRRKEVGMLDVPYSSTKKKKVEFLKELSIFDANQLGLVHGRQPHSAAYLNAIRSDIDAFHKATNAVGDWYLEEAAKAMPGH